MSSRSSYSRNASDAADLIRPDSPLDDFLNEDEEEKQQHYNESDQAADEEEEILPQLTSQ